VSLPPSLSDRDDIDRITAMARAALSEDAFAGAFERGGALTPSRARAIVDDVDVRHR
jgi:hypothetical protein